MIDLDELIIPYKKDTLTELIAGDLYDEDDGDDGDADGDYDDVFACTDLSSKTMVQAGKSLPPSQVIKIKK